MNWEGILAEAIVSIMGIVFSALGGLVTYWISKKIKDEKLKGIAESLHDVVRQSVLDVYQTYVEGLKEKDIFDSRAQKIALERALSLIHENIPANVGEWLKSNHENIDGYLKTLIEAQIASLKR